MTLFPIRLKSLRKESGKTQQDMADYLGVNRVTYGGYERGDIVPPYEKIQKLSEKFGVTVDYLMGQTNFLTYDIKNSDIPDVSTQFKIIADELMSNTSLVKCNGKMMTNQEKEELLPFVNSVIKFIDIVSQYKEEK